MRTTASHADQWRRLLSRPALEADDMEGEGRRLRGRGLDDIYPFERYAFAVDD